MLVLLPLLGCKIQLRTVLLVSWNVIMVTKPTFYISDKKFCNIRCSSVFMPLPHLVNASTRTGRVRISIRIWVGVRNRVEFGLVLVVAFMQCGAKT